MHKNHNKFIMRSFSITTTKKQPQAPRPKAVLNAIIPTLHHPKNLNQIPNNIIRLSNLQLLYSMRPRSDTNT